jgi:mRNA interferase RelE/StbE
MQKPDAVNLSSFRVFETDEFTKQFKKLSSSDAVFLRKKLNDYTYPQIMAEPFWGNNIKKLRGASHNIWRYRIGRFRLFYSIDKNGKIVSILTIDDRKDVYKK